MPSSLPSHWLPTPTPRPHSSVLCTARNAHAPSLPLCFKGRSRPETLGMGKWEASAFVLPGR